MKVIFTSVLIILLDQASKIFIKGCSLPFLGIDWKGYPLYTSYSIVGDFLKFTYIENAGMAFGIDIGGKLFFSIFSIVASLGILLYLYKARNENLAFRISLAMILGGAIGNLIDRVFYGVLYDEGAFFYGKVVDFIDADFFNLNLFGYHLSRWPVFNIADASVTCGVVLMLFAHRKIVKEETLIPADAIGGAEVISSEAVSQDQISSSSSGQSLQS